jgi:hypothetical protein
MQFISMAGLFKFKALGSWQQYKTGDVEDTDKKEIHIAGPARELNLSNHVVARHVKVLDALKKVSGLSIPCLLFY